MAHGKGMVDRRFLMDRNVLKPVSGGWRFLLPDQYRSRDSTAF